MVLFVILPNSIVGSGGKFGGLVQAHKINETNKRYYYQRWKKDFSFAFL